MKGQVEKYSRNTSLVVQRLRLHNSTAGEGGTIWIPGRGTEIPHVPQCSQKKKKKKILGFAEQSLSQLVNATKMAIDDTPHMGVTVFQYN